MPDELHAKAVLGKLSRKYPAHGHYLNFKTHLDLLVATILSAQVPDERVNAVTKDLFKRYRKAEHYARLSHSQLANNIKTISFAGNKAKYIVEACKVLVDKHNSRVPDNIKELVKLPGIGRKTANAILIHAYGIVEGIPCDTHVLRVSYRLGWTSHKNPDKVEQDLMNIIPKRLWKRLPQILKDHGRAVCKAPTPLCNSCIITSICPKRGVIRHK